MEKRIMVTGSNGYIGCILCKNLIERGYKVVGIDSRLFPKNFKLEGYPYEVEGVDYYVKDIRDLTEKDFKYIDILVHLAGLSNDPIGEIDHKMTREINVYATVEMVSQAKRAGVKKLVFSSSCSVYGYNSLDSPKFFDEDSPKNPVSSYAESKLVTEGALRNMIDRHFKVYILRNATVFGPSPRMRFDLLINAMVATSFFTNTITFYSNPMVKRPLIHIFDLSRIFIYFIENDLELDTYNIGKTRENYSIADIAVLVSQAFYERFGIDIKLRYKIDNTDPRSYLVNFDRLYPHCKKLFRYDINRKIRDLIDQFLLNFNRRNNILEKEKSFFSILYLKEMLESGKMSKKFRIKR